MQRAFECTDGGADRGIHVAQSRGNNTGGEGAGIEAVFSMQDVSNVEGLLGFLARHFAIDQIQKVSGFAQVLAHWRQIKSLARTVVVGSNHTDL